MQGSLKGLLVLIISILAIIFAFTNIAALIALALIVWGGYEYKINRKLGARLRVPGLIITFGVLMLFSAVLLNSPEETTTATNQVESPQTSKPEQTNAIIPAAHQTETDTSTNAAITKDSNEETTDTEPELISAVVTNIVDGDTFDVEINGKEERVRLLLVDTPETKDPDKPVQPFGPEATEFAEKTLSGKEVRLEFDGPERDKYDRLLVYLWVGDKIFNQMLLEEGLARIAYVYDPPYKYYDAFVAAQERAKKEKKGIWSIPEYVTEDGFNEKVVALKKTDTSAKQSTTSKQTAQQQSTTKEKQTKEKQNTKQKEVYYARCADARAAGAAPIYKGEPGYRPALDRDGDGIACE